MSGTGVMRAAVISAPGEVSLQSVEIPQVRNGEIRVRMEGCGVCASNLGPWSGPEWQEFPLAPGELGHEGWGVIDEVGPGVSEFRPGDRVATLSYRSYAEMDIAPADAVVKLPPQLGDIPFPGEPLGCAFNIFERCDILAGQYVAIIGIGFLGAVLTRLASSAGGHVIAISRRPESLQLAQEMGAELTVEMADHRQIVEAVGDVTGGAMCPRVIECVGGQGPLDLAGELIGMGGRLVIAGYHQNGPRSVDMQMWNWKGIDVINAHERDLSRQKRGVENAIAAVLADRIDPLRLCTHSYPLEQLDMALNATRDKPQGFVKALIRL